jgi:nitrite reductase/ring-hydroxylating ferredoxin subunit
MSKSISVCKTFDVKPGRGFSVYIGKKRIAVYLVEEQYYVLDDECLHRGAPLSEGVVDGHSITCPLHDWTYHIKTGALLDRAGVALRTYPVQIQGDEIFIEWPDEIK